MCVIPRVHSDSRFHVCGEKQLFNCCVCMQLCISYTLLNIHVHPMASIADKARCALWSWVHLSFCVCICTSTYSTCTSTQVKIPCLGGTNSCSNTVCALVSAIHFCTPRYSRQSKVCFVIMSSLFIYVCAFVLACIVLVHSKSRFHDWGEKQLFNCIVSAIHIDHCSFVSSHFIGCVHLY